MPNPPIELDIRAQRDLVVSVIGATALTRSDDWVRGAFKGISHRMGRSAVADAAPADPRIAALATARADAAAARASMIADAGAAWRDDADRIGDAVVRQAVTASPATASRDAREHMIQRLRGPHPAPFRTMN